MRLMLAAFACLTAACAHAQDEALPESQFVDPAEASEDVRAEEISFQDWIADFSVEAMDRGYAPDLLDLAFGTVDTPNQTVVRLSESQPEFVRPVSEYLEGAVSPARIAPGRERLAAQASLFEALERAYAVDREALTAIWGLESAYGAILGDFDVFRSYATLGWAGWRPVFVREQLYAALDILAEGQAARDQLKGSWAGAMGQTQFIPATYRRYAQDWNSDGVRDLWDNDGDALASAARYLSQSGWAYGAPWGVEVILAETFDWSIYDETSVRPAAEWGALGVTRADGADWQGALAGAPARLLLPMGHRGPAFLTFDNFEVIKEYNNSTAYALAVGMLSDAFRGESGLVADWPDSGRPLRREEVFELQDRLTHIGYDTGGSDGLIGPLTRRAVRAFQRSRNLTPDGYVDAEFLDRVRQATEFQ